MDVGVANVGVVVAAVVVAVVVGVGVVVEAGKGIGNRPLRDRDHGTAAGPDEKDDNQCGQPGPAFHYPLLPHPTGGHTAATGQLGFGAEPGSRPAASMPRWICWVGSLVSR